MKKIWKRMLSPVIAVLCMVLSAVPAFAGGGLDPGAEGSISVGIRAYATDEAVSGGSLNLYRVADMTAPGGEAVYSYTKGFAGCDEALLTNEALAVSSTAETFAQWAESNGAAAAQTVPVGTDGKACFSGLSAGLYMVTQDVAADGYNPINAFLVSVPTAENGTWVYDVEAAPKTSPAGNTQDLSPGSETGGSAADSGVQTGDDTGAGVYLLAGTVSAACAAAIAAGRKRTGEKRRRT